MRNVSTRGVIVVGVDGSEASKDALRWAATQAELTATELHAITVWRTPAAYGYAPDYSDVDFAADTRKVLDTTITETLGSTPRIPVVTSVIEGHPAQVLTQTSASATLLVVGRHGHGAFTGMLLGSVSQHCVQHASCPVLVIPSPERT